MLAKLNNCYKVLNVACNQAKNIEEFLAINNDSDVTIKLDKETNVSSSVSDYHYKIEYAGVSFEGTVRIGPVSFVIMVPKFNAYGETYRIRIVSGDASLLDFVGDDEQGLNDILTRMGRLLVDFSHQMEKVEDVDLQV